MEVLTLFHLLYGLGREIYNDKAMSLYTVAVHP